MGQAFLMYFSRKIRSFLGRLYCAIFRRLPEPVQRNLSQEDRQWLIDTWTKIIQDNTPVNPFRQYLGDGEIFVTTKYFNMFLPGWDLSLTPAILSTGVWESGLTGYFKEKVKPGMIAFDVGANIGWFSSLFASSGAHVHAFEPNPRLQRILKKNIFINAGHYTPMCTVNQCAISDRVHVVPMRFPHWLIGGAGLHDFDQSPFLDSLVEEDVITNVITLDSHAKNMNIKRVDVIKIDIEGYEEQALLGATELISRSPGLILSIEWTRGCYSASFPAWLFERFGDAYVPALNQKIDLEFLEKYEARQVLAETALIDIVLVAK